MSSQNERFDVTSSKRDVMRFLAVLNIYSLGLSVRVPLMQDDAVQQVTKVYCFLILFNVQKVINGESPKFLITF